MNSLVKLCRSNPYCDLDLEVPEVLWSCGWLGVVVPVERIPASSEAGAEPAAGQT